MFTAQLKKAINHVKSFHPTLRYVIFDSDGRWLYTDDELTPFKFDDNISVEVLEDAQDSVSELPAIFDVTNG